MSIAPLTVATVFHFHTMAQSPFDCFQLVQIKIPSPSLSSSSSYNLNRWEPKSWKYRRRRRRRRCRTNIKVCQKKKSQKKKIELASLGHAINAYFIKVSVCVFLRALQLPRALQCDGRCLAWRDINDGTVGGRFASLLQLTIKAAYWFPLCNLFQSFWL